MKIQASNIDEFKQMEALVKKFPECVSDKISLAWKHSTGIFFFETTDNLKMKIAGEFSSLRTSGTDPIEVEVQTRMDKDTLYFKMKVPKGCHFSIG